MTNATVQCENCSKTKRFANATVYELDGRTYICEGCTQRLVMIRKTDFTLTGVPVAGWFVGDPVSMEKINGESLNSN